MLHLYLTYPFRYSDKGTTFLLLRIVAETLHRRREGNKGWDDQHIENNVEADPTINETNNKG